VGAACASWLFVLLAACQPSRSAKPRVLPATRVEIQIRSDFGAELGRVEVATFDEAGAEMGELARLGVDQTFVVVQAAGSSRERFGVVANGYSPSDELLITQRMLVEFSENQLRRYELWLRAACRGTACATDQSCEPDDASAPVCVALVEAAPVSEQSTEAEADSPTTPPAMMGESSARGDGGTDAAPAADGGRSRGDGPAPRASYTETTTSHAALTSGGKPRRNAPGGATAARLLYDDGFELEGRVCNANSLCVTAGFEP